MEYNIDIVIEVPYISSLVESEIVLPIETIKDKGHIYRGTVSAEGVADGNTMMINGKAPYGSREEDAVWKVYYNEVNHQGTVVSTTIQENVTWREIINN